MAYYVTTPIYYVNGFPHIGHAYTTMVADTLARFHRQRGEDVFFMTGTDEHGLKVQREAERRGITPKALADENSAKFRELFDRLGLKYDRFIRTTEDAHRVVVEAVVDAMLKNDDIYLSQYAGWYSTADEAFYDESEIEDGKAIASGSTVEWVEEESYFFRLSKYQDRLLEWYALPESVQPDVRRNEVRSFVEGGLRDLSISRTTFNWGIPLPNDPKHVLYVWVDALTNYITGVGAYGADPKAWETFWPASVHLVGKDILRFHAVYWPAFLMSAGLEPPRQVFAHGWWLNEGVKMSKSLGNFLDAFELAESYDLDVLRYYLLREVPFGDDGSFVEANLVGRNNSELANNFGNLVNRTLKMLQKFCDGQIPENVPSGADDVLIAAAKERRDEVFARVDKLSFNTALEAILGLSSDLNLYLQENQPWKLAKDETQRARLEEVMYNTIEGIRWVTTLFSSFLPGATVKVFDALGVAEDARGFDTLAEWGGLKAGHTVSIPEVLFARLELPKEEEPAPVEEPVAEPEPEPSYIDFDAFMAVEILVGEVKTAERVKKSDKLLRLTVDLGEAEPRTIMAGIAGSYAPEDLVGNRYAVVANLKPRKIFKVLSQGMMMAADTEDGGVLLTSFPSTVPVGTRLG